MFTVLTAQLKLFAINCKIIKKMNVSTQINLVNFATSNFKKLKNMHAF